MVTSCSNCGSGDHPMKSNQLCFDSVECEDRAMRTKLVSHLAAVAEMQRLWGKAWDLMNQVHDIAGAQGFFMDLHDIHYARQHIAFVPQFRHTEANVHLRIRQLDERLDFWYRTVKDYRPRDEATEQWILISRQDAERQGFRMFLAWAPGQPEPWHGRLLFKELHRLYAEPDDVDLVYAIAPI